MAPKGGVPPGGIHHQHENIRLWKHLRQGFHYSFGTPAPDKSKVHNGYA
jgi:hypothetical protein